MRRKIISVEAFLEATGDDTDSAIDDTLSDAGIDDSTDDGSSDDSADAGDDDTDDTSSDDSTDDNTDDSGDDGTDDSGDGNDSSGDPGEDIVSYIKKRDDQDFDKKIKVKLIKSLNGLIDLCDEQISEITDDHRVSATVQMKIEVEKKELIEIRKLLNMYVLDSAPVRSRNDVLETLIKFKDIYENVVRSINSKIKDQS